VQVGDLVKFRLNDAIGIVFALYDKKCVSGLFCVQWTDGVINNRFGDELEVISASR
jgi:hypothetical protein